ncbi:MAG TPA: GntR family transcriptional regulator, partial [Thermoanaerobaculaceae bacterium]|nr:GntR family transcriptional regulator [Thermoanaerobaculaceae bacterium]
ELLPSIRALAREYRVSVITVQRAYEDLEREGLLHSHPGKGFYVAEHPEQMTRTIATRRFAVAFADLVARSRAEGLDEAELGQAIREVLSGGGQR